MYHHQKYNLQCNLRIRPPPSASESLPTSSLQSKRNIKNCILFWCLLFTIVIIPNPIFAVATPKYETAYACEGKTLTIECEPGDIINLIRANYGRFSITICNDHGNVDWSVNCMSAKSLRVLHTKCSHKQYCSVLASTNMFGDPCTGTHKYLEAHYQCVSAALTLTTTNRSSPPWLMTSQPSVWSTSTIRVPTTTRVAFPDDKNNDSSALLAASTLKTAPVFEVHKSNSGGESSSSSSSLSTSTSSPRTSSSSSSSSFFSSSLMLTASTQPWSSKFSENSVTILPGLSTISPQQKQTNNSIHHSSFVSTSVTKVAAAAAAKYENESSIVLLSSANSGDGRFHQDDSTIIGDLNTYATTKPSNLSSSLAQNHRNNNSVDDEYCMAKTSRNLFWNSTRVGEVNVQPCPGGATGIAKWRCVYSNQITLFHLNNNISPFVDGKSTTKSNLNKYKVGDTNNNGDATTTRNINNVRVSWQSNTPDLTHCRSLWLNSLEVRVNQRDSSLISIANDLSQVTSSKTLYGGDMLVTTKIIQTMSEKMTYDIETYPDQRQREAIVTELLHGVVKTGSNLLDITQQYSWLDLSFEDQMRVATSLLTGLEDNAFLLAETIIRERNIVQKVKNILLSVRVLETRNIIGNEIFPDINYEKWHVSDDSVELPQGALIENSENGLVRIVFVAFDRLETILKPVTIDIWTGPTQLVNTFNSGVINRNSSSSTGTVPLSSSSSSLPPVQYKNRILNSKVISASLGKGRHIQLSQPIRLNFRHLKTENVSNATCVFWNYIDHAWSEDGCYVELSNRTHTICMCNHLTNFAILMDIMDDFSSALLSIFDSNIRILMYISISICIIFLIIALVTLRFFGGIFVKSSRKTIYKNLYICLLMVEVLFLLGIEQNEANVLCGFTTTFLHCAFLCTISWVFIEGFQLYITLTSEEIVDVEKSSKLIWFYLMTYGLSFTIVAISLGIDPAAYTQSDYCIWMESNKLFYFTFVSPIFLYIMTTISLIGISSFILCNKYRMSLKNKEHSRLVSMKFYLRCLYTFMAIIVLCWIFAYIYMYRLKTDIPNANVFGYLFVVFNAFQGIYIFGFHCINNENIRREYLKYVRQNAWLPQCLRCATTNSPSPIVTSVAAHCSGTDNHHHHHDHHQHHPIAQYHQQQQQQQQLQQQQLHSQAIIGSSMTIHAVVASRPNTTKDCHGLISSTIGARHSGGGFQSHEINSNVDGDLETMIYNHNNSGKQMANKIFVDPDDNDYDDDGIHVAAIVNTIGGGGGVGLGFGFGDQTSPTLSAGSTHVIYKADDKADTPIDWCLPFEVARTNDNFKINSPYRQQKILSNNQLQDSTAAIQVPFEKGGMSSSIDSSGNNHTSQRNLKYLDNPQQQQQTMVHLQRKKKRIKPYQSASLSSSSSSSSPACQLGFSQDQPPSPDCDGKLTTNIGQQQKQQHDYYWTTEKTKKQNNSLTKPCDTTSSLSSYKKKQFELINCDFHRQNNCQNNIDHLIFDRYNRQKYSNTQQQQQQHQQHQSPAEQVQLTSDDLENCDHQYQHHLNVNIHNRAHPLASHQQNDLHLHPSSKTQLSTEESILNKYQLSGQERIDHCDGNDSFSEEPVYEEIMSHCGGGVGGNRGGVGYSAAVLVNDYDNQIQHNLNGHEHDYNHFKDNFGNDDELLDDRNISINYKSFHDNSKIGVTNLRQSSRPVIMKSNYDFNHKFETHTQQQPQSQEESQQQPQKQYLHQQQQHQQQQQQQSAHIGRNLSAMLNENNTVICYLEPILSKKETSPTNTQAIYVKKSSR